jgi:hypothetical protein
MRFVHAIKRRLHRDIVADPVLHARVLNLYLNGEQYPHRVADYFPMGLVEESQIAARLRDHLREEDKHVALYTKAIRALGQPVVELPLPQVYNTVILRHTGMPAVAERDYPDGRRLALAHFFAHLHFLESRVAHSLEYHLDACAHAAHPYPAKAVEVILRDERKHAAYTRDTVDEVVPVSVARRVLAHHRAAESRANREFSSRELERLLREEGGRFAGGRRTVYAAGAALLGGGFHG